MLAACLEVYVFESVTKRRKNPLINIFGWTLLTVVCVVFVFIGFSPNSSFLGQGGAAAEVNGDAISLREFKELLDRLDSNSGQAPQGQEGRRRVQENALNILVSRSLIVQEAEKLNIHVSDAEVGQELLDIEPFYEDGSFSRLRYKTYLRQARLTESEFENKIRKDLIIQKMSNLVGFAAKDIGIIDDFDEKIDQAQVNVGYVKLTPQAFQSRSKQTPEEFIAKNEAKIKEYYQNHKSEYTTPDQVKARHILIKAEDQKPESMEKALKKMVEIASKTNVENFSAMAEKHSDDPGSKAKGGDLGFFPRGRMVPEFEKAAFGSEKGKITEPVKTKYGYHIILVDDRKEASEEPLESVQVQIAQKLMSEGAYEEGLSEVKELMKAKKYSELESLLSDKGLKWTNTGFFSITKENIPGVGTNKEFLDLAIGLSPENEYGSRLVYQGDSAYLLKYKGSKTDGALAKNDQMDFFKQLMKQQKMNMMIQSWTDSLKESASIKTNPDLLR